MGAKEGPDLPVTCPFFVATLLDQYGEHSCKVHPSARTQVLLKRSQPPDWLPALRGLRAESEVSSYRGSVLQGPKVHPVQSVWQGKHWVRIQLGAGQQYCLPR